TNRSSRLSAAGQRFPSIVISPPGDSLACYRDGHKDSRNLTSATPFLHAPRQAWPTAACDDRATSDCDARHVQYPSNQQELYKVPIRNSHLAALAVTLLAGLCIAPVSVGQINHADDTPHGARPFPLESTLDIAEYSHVDLSPDGAWLAFEWYERDGTRMR